MTYKRRPLHPNTDIQTIQTQKVGFLVRRVVGAAVSGLYGLYGLYVCIGGVASLGNERTSGMLSASCWPWLQPAIGSSGDLIPHGSF